MPTTITLRRTSRRCTGALQQAEGSAQAQTAHGKDHGTINSDLGNQDDEPTKALFEFVLGVLAKDQRQ